MVVYREMTPEDIPAGLALCRSAGWNQTSRDWEFFIRIHPGGSQVAVEEDGMVVGTVATLRYRDHFSWISMVLVDPTKQRQGIGIQLLRESLRILCDDDTVKLDATPSGREIYLQLNFVDEYPLTRMHNGALSTATLPASSARPVCRNDLTTLQQFDREVFGADRGNVLEWLVEGAPQYAFLLEEQGNISGYCFGRQGYHFTHIGPVVSRTPDGAKQILSAALRTCGGKQIIIDALKHSAPWTDWLTSIGFEAQRPLMRMYRGTNAHPGLPQFQFAILGPEFG